MNWGGTQLCKTINFHFRLRGRRQRGSIQLHQYIPSRLEWHSGDGVLIQSLRPGWRLLIILLEYNKQREFARTRRSIYH